MKIQKDLNFLLALRYKNLRRWQKLGSAGKVPAEMEERFNQKWNKIATLSPLYSHFSYSNESQRGNLKKETDSLLILL